MAQERNRRKKDVSKETIFEKQTKAKLSAKDVLKLAKQQESDKLKIGFSYKMLSDGKTFVLTNKV